jgi:hypothetical protein
MEQGLNFIAHAWIGLLGVAAMLALAVGLYLILNTKARKRRLVALRAKLDEMKPSDPEYGQVRTLYNDMAIHAHRRDVLDESNSGDGRAHHDGGSHSTGDYAAAGGARGD